MAVNAPVSSGLELKRSLSSMQDDFSGWESASPMGAPPLCPHFILPFSHYILIYYDDMDRVKVSVSPSIQEQDCAAFTPEVCEKFLEIIGPKIEYNKPLIYRPSVAQYCHPHDTAAYHCHGKRCKTSSQDPNVGMSFSEYFPEPIPQIPSPTTNNMVALVIGHTQKVLEYYETALEHFQQINCRLIAREFIKFIEPRKQIKHPYNGGRLRAGAPPGKKGDSEKTKPEWWPAGVQHKEPDHLRKHQRIRLLIHILRNLGRFNITSQSLQEVAQDSKRQLRPEESIEDKMEILNEILKVRQLEEQFEWGEVDAYTMVHIRNRDALANNIKEKESVVSGTGQKIDPEDEEDPLNSTSFKAHLPSFPAIDPLDRSQKFPMNGSFNFGDQSRQTASTPITVSRVRR